MTRTRSFHSLVAALLLVCLRATAATTQPPIDNCSGGAAAINPNCGSQNGNAMDPGNAHPPGGGTTTPPGGGGSLGGGTGGSGGYGGTGSNPGSTGGYAHGVGSNPGDADAAKQPGTAGGGTAPGAAAGAAPVSPFGPGNPLTIRAGVELQMGDLASACVSATAALKQDPEDKKAAKIAAEACRTGQVSGPKTKTPEPQDGPAGRDIALDDKKAGKLLRGGAEGGLLASVPAELQDLLSRILAANAAGDDVLVTQLCEEGLKDHPDSVHLLNALALALNKLKDHKGALEAAERSIKADPNGAIAHLNKAKALEGLGDREGMLESLRRAAALDPQFEALLKAALAGGAKGLFDDLIPRGKRPANLPWIVGAAAGVFLLLVILILLARRAGPATASWTPAAAAGEKSEPIEPGTVLGGCYRVESEIGRGGMGVVFAALDEKLQRRVAIKQLKLESGATADDRARFLREARLVAQLKHPNLAEIYNVLDEGGEQLLVFEFVDGRTLDKVLYAARRIPLEQAAGVLQEMAAGIDYAHERKIIHRDLKPSNVMLARAGGLKIMDFGIAHQARTGSADTRTAAWGTPHYMAPEQAMGSVSKASDLYALGVIAYELATGARPFEGPDFVEPKLRKSFTPVTGRDSSLPAALDGFFASVLDPDPAKRPASASAFVAAFRLAAGTPRPS